MIERFIGYLEANGRAGKYIQRAGWLKRDCFARRGGLAMTNYQEWVEEFKRRELQRGRRPNGINSDLRLVKALFNWGAEAGYCQPVKVQLLKAERTLARFLDEEEIAALFRAVEEAPVMISRKGLKQDDDYWRGYWRLVFEMYLFTGGRKEEVARLTWGDIDFNRGLVRFTKTKGNRERWVELEPWLVEKLRGFRIRDSGVRSQDAKIWWHSGNWLYEGYVYYVRAAGFTERGKLHLHALRHSCVSHLLQAGVDIRTVAEIIGHEDPALTLRTYAHVAPKGRREAMGRLSQRLGRG